MNDLVGKTILHYRILEQIGQGGMGVVYKAEDTKLKRTVALKFLPAKTLAGETEKTRFIHEAQASAALAGIHCQGLRHGRSTPGWRHASCMLYCWQNCLQICILLYQLTETYDSAGEVKK